MKKEYFGHDLSGREVWVINGKTLYKVVEESASYIRNVYPIGKIMTV